MKRLFLTICCFCVSLYGAAQSVSYANAVKISRMTSVTQINSFMKSLGYQLSETYPEMKKDVSHSVVDVFWKYGSCTEARRNYDGSDSFTWDADYPSAGFKVQFCKTHNCVYQIYWLFPSNRTYSNLILQLKQAGWKLVAEHIDSDGLSNFYRKEKQSNWIDIRESDDCYEFFYCTGR